MPQAISYRPICAEDEPFLYCLYASTRESELAITGWDAAQKEAFLRMQFAAQHKHYQDHYSDTSFDLILHEGAPIGRLYLARWPNEVRIVDITIDAAWRKKGIGSAILKNILREAQADGLAVRIHVESFNPAQHLYYRLGFEKIADKGVYYLLEWSS